MTNEEQSRSAGEILAALNPGPGQPVPHPGPPPDTSGFTETAEAKARGEYQAKHDAHVESLLKRPSGSLTPDELKTLAQAVAVWAKSER
jgi:hypothetical protein